jgi:hypothetical protein
MNKKHPKYFQWLTILLLLLFSSPTLSAETLPQFFGLYLRTGEQLIELQAGTVEGGGLASLTRIAVSIPTPSLILYHDQHSPHNLQLTQLDYTFHAGEPGKWMPTKSIPLKIAPVEGKQSMYLLVPGESLVEGVYAAHFGSLSVKGTGLESQAYSFVVGDPERVIDLTVHRTNAEVYAGQQATWDQAIVEYQQCLRIVPNDAAFQEKLALLYYQKQDYPAAIEALQRLLTLAPETQGVQEKLLEGYLQLGHAATQKKQYPSALEHLAQALPLAEQVEPDKVAVIAGLQAEIYYEQQDFGQAFNAAQQASEKGAPSSKPYVILAFLYLRQGNQQEALKFLDLAAKRGLGNDVGGYLLVNTGYGNLTIPVKDVASVTPASVSLKSGEVFKGEVRLEIER